jgi:hypothetical protein
MLSVIASATKQKLCSPALLAGTRRSISVQVGSYSLGRRPRFSREQDSPSCMVAKRPRRRAKSRSCNTRGLLEEGSMCMGLKVCLSLAIHLCSVVPLVHHVKPEAVAEYKEAACVLDLPQYVYHLSHLYSARSTTWASRTIRKPM